MKYDGMEKKQPVGCCNIDFCVQIVRLHNHTIYNIAIKFIQPNLESTTNIYTSTRMDADAVQYIKMRPFTIIYDYIHCATYTEKLDKIRVPNTKCHIFIHKKRRRRRQRCGKRQRQR